MADSTNGFDKDYSEGSFWDKLIKYAKDAGKEVIEKALWLYYTMQEPGTPAWAKSIIIGALGYFISPLDIIPDVMPLVGYTDDLGVLAAAITAVAAYITDNAKEQAKAKLAQWFGA